MTRPNKERILSLEELQEFKDRADSSGGYILEKKIYRYIDALTAERDFLASSRNEHMELHQKSIDNLEEALKRDAVHGKIASDIAKERDTLRERVGRLRGNLEAISTGCTGRDTDSCEYADMALAADDKWEKS